MFSSSYPLDQDFPFFLITFHALCVCSGFGIYKVLILIKTFMYVPITSKKKCGFLLKCFLVLVGLESQNSCHEQSRRKYLSYSCTVLEHMDRQVQLLLPQSKHHHQLKYLHFECPALHYADRALDCISAYHGSMNN